MSQHFLKQELSCHGPEKKSKIVLFKFYFCPKTQNLEAKSPKIAQKKFASIKIFTDSVYLSTNVTGTIVLFHTAEPANCTFSWLQACNCTFHTRESCILLSNKAVTLEPGCLFTPVTLTFECGPANSVKWKTQNRRCPWFGTVATLALLTSFSTNNHSSVLDIVGWI